MRALHCLRHVACVMKMSLQGKGNITSVMRHLAPRLAALSLANHFIVRSQSDLGLSQLIIQIVSCRTGKCSSVQNTHTPEQGVRFVPFAKPTRTLETFFRWSKACGCPHSQSNVNFFIFYYFYYSKQSEFRTRKERLSQ